jgi:3-keto-L-gulonate-6-phosphate decarboxylase
MGAVVARWSGLEARALREAKRMSVREFAAHLGLNDAAVASWERRGALAQLRYETQQLLDVDLAALDEAGLQRFRLILGQSGTESASSGGSEQGAAGVTAHRSAADPDGGGADHGLGERSALRTSAVVAATLAGKGGLSPSTPAEAVARLRRFVRSAARVYVVKGPPGCGKTTAVERMAVDLAGEIDVQLHSAQSWPLGQLGLASEILRYASTPSGADPFLMLERQAGGLVRGLLVVIDGIDSRERLHEVGRQLDLILRQVTQSRLRFGLVLRTPPEMDLSAHPVLAASVYEPDPRDVGVSHRMGPWDVEQARAVWDTSREPDQPAFDDLPAPVRQLATLPLYLALMHAAGRAAPNPLHAFDLVDHCVQVILRRAGVDVAADIDALADLAMRGSGPLVPPGLLRQPLPDHTPAFTMSPGLQPLVVSSLAGPRFAHDVIAEYFAAVRITDLLSQAGRSMSTVNAFNDLAEQATSSASARGVFQFVVACLDRRDPQLATAITLSPAVSPEITLPLMLQVAPPGARFLTAQALQAAAGRCGHAAALELARSLLGTPAVVTALAEEHSKWIVTLLRVFGPAVWADVASHLERTLDVASAARLLAAADLDGGEEATFFARHAFLLQGIPAGRWLEPLVAHDDWRVRAALADGLLTEPADSRRAPVAAVRRLATDEDYKVRAALARVIAGVSQPAWAEHVETLASDDNWHVRASVLRGFLHGRGTAVEISAGEAAAWLLDDAAWLGAPTEATRLRHRLLLLSGVGKDDSAARQQALFGLLRETRTGWTDLPGATLERLLADGEGVDSWLIRREVEAIRAAADGRGTAGPTAEREGFRRRRDRRAVQVALDLRNLAHALEVARAVAESGVDFIEVGDPLIKQVGVRAVEHVKRVVGPTRVVAEMMSADWGRDQVEQAAEAGADVVLLIGPATAASVSSAVEAGRRLGTPILLDVPMLQASQSWALGMERLGIDGFAVTSNIDIGIGGGHPLARARALRSWTKLPVAVSGGFSVTDVSVTASRDWDILIVGRGVTEAVQPRVAAERLLTAVRTQDGRQDGADHRP